MTTIDLLKKTKAAWGSIRSANAEEKNRLLLAMAESLEANQADILRENQKDMDAARESISDVMLDRLALTQARIHAMADGIREAAALPDHVGRALAQFTRPNGMTITKRQVPLGLVAIIYESRPNVTSDAAALCIKSGNVCMLRSGKEAYRSSHAIVTALKAGIESVGGDGDIVNIDYKGTKDGEAFDGGTAEGQDLTLGSGSMIDGFEDGLVGAKKGETKTLDLTFPENYREESLAGQAVVFEVTVNAVKEKQDAVLDDAFVQRTSDYQTVDEYKEGIRADLLAQKQKTAEQEMEQDVLQDIIDNSDFKFSRNGLSVRYNQMLKQYTNQAKMYGMTLSQMAQANGMDEAGFKEYIYSSVKEAAKKEIVVKDIAAKEGLDNLTDEDKEAFAQANGMTKDTLVSLYGEDTVKEHD